MHSPRLTALTRLVGAAVLAACLGAAHAVPALAVDNGPEPAHVDEIFMLTKDGQLINRVSITDPLGRIDYKRCQAMESTLAPSSRADQTDVRGTDSGNTTICDLTMSYNDANLQTEVKAGVNGTWALDTKTFATSENMQQLFSVPMAYRSATVMVEGTVDENSSSSQARLGTDETVSDRVFTVARWDTAPGQLVAAGSLTAGGVALADDPSRAITSPASAVPVYPGGYSFYTAASAATPSASSSSPAPSLAKRGTNWGRLIVAGIVAVCAAGFGAARRRNKPVAEPKGFPPPNQWPAVPTEYGQPASTTAPGAPGTAPGAPAPYGVPGASGAAAGDQGWPSTPFAPTAPESMAQAGQAGTAPSDPSRFSPEARPPSGMGEFVIPDDLSALDSLPPRGAAPGSGSGSAARPGSTSEPDDAPDSDDEPPRGNYKSDGKRCD